MRDQLEEALRHQDAGYGRAHHLNSVELPKRFYKSVDVARSEEGYAITLDGRPLRTPGKKVPIALPALDLAQVMAEEWAAQGSESPSTARPSPFPKIPSAPASTASTPPPCR